MNEGVRIRESVENGVESWRLKRESVANPTSAPKLGRMPIERHVIDFGAQTELQRSRDKSWEEV